MATAADRSHPNVLVTGTPGTGKTCTCAQIAERAGLRHVNVTELVAERGLHRGRDEEWDSLIFDEDKVCDEMEDMMSAGGCVVDFHTCDFFPERWFDLVLVLRADNTVLYDRLQKRGYAAKKITENVECEIMQVILQDAREGYAEQIVHELQSDTVEQLEANAERVVQWADQWRRDKAAGGGSGGGGGGPGGDGGGAGATASD